VHRLRDKALLLKRYAYGESSLVAHLATRDHGRVHVLAKGAYRTTSRFFAVLDVFDTLEIEWSGPPRRELKTLHTASIARRRRGVADDLGRYRAALTMLELAELVSRAEHRDRALFDLLEDGLGQLDDRVEEAPTLALVRFELGFLHGAGLAPALDRCAACGGAAPPVIEPSRAESSPYAVRAAFSAGAGGRLCRACAEEARAAGRRVGTLPSCVLETARELSLALDRSDEQRVPGRYDEPPGGPLGRPSQEWADGERLDRVRDFVGRFLDYHLETRPRSHRAFLAEPNRNAP
jgi:DNA repair protein RecO